MKKKYIITLLLGILLLLFILGIIFGRHIILMAFAYTDRLNCKINTDKYAAELETIKNCVLALHPQTEEYYLSVTQSGNVTRIFDSAADDDIMLPNDVTTSMITIDGIVSAHTSSEHVILVRGDQVIFTCCGSYALVYAPDGQPDDVPLRDCDKIVIQNAGGNWYHVFATERITFANTTKCIMRILFSCL